MVKSRSCITPLWRQRMVLWFVFAATTFGSAFVVKAPFITFSWELSATTTTELEQMTVKELRQLLKDSNLQKRGLLSRLKRKQDLVDYLHQHLSTTEHEEDTSPTTVVVANGSVNERKHSKKTPLSMPSNTPKDLLFESVYERYPPLRNATTKVGENETDVRQLYHPMLQNFSKTSTTSDMDIVFCGTASCTPGTTRGVSCTALRLNWKRRSQISNSGVPQYSEFNGGTWLFDVGECTQLQIQRTPHVKPGRITKIFITHAHGDHSFGLPGLLCLMGQDRSDSGIVDIYGPQGLRMWLRVAIRYSVSRIVPPYRVHEVHQIPMAPEWQRHKHRHVYTGKMTRQWHHFNGHDSESWVTQCNNVHLPPSSQFGEVPGGRDIMPQYNHELSSDGAPVWLVEDEGDVQVYAAPMSHGVPCLGYVVKEQSRPGRLRNDLVEPIVRRNLSQLKQAGFGIPMKCMAVIKNLPKGSAFTFPDGTVLSQEEAVEPPRQGRKVVVCGDTADARSLETLAQNADVVIHEATNTYLAGIDKDTNLRAVTKDTRVHGHSTPYMAGEFAKKVGAKRLVLNHFSARYKGDPSIDSISLMTRIEGQAVQASNLSETQVAAAWDLMVLPIPQN